MGSRKYILKEVGSRLAERRTWKKLAQEHQGEMFGIEAGEKPSLAEKKGDWVHKDRGRS